MTVEEHALAFANSFVIPAKRQRWRELLSKRGKSAFRDSSKLMDALDGRFCEKVDGRWKLDPARRGVFYDFCDEPSAVTLAEAENAGDYQDAIFSPEKGRLAIHFSHEGWSWLCQR